MIAPLKRICALLCLLLPVSVAQAQEVGVFELHFDADVFQVPASAGFPRDVFVAFGQRGEPRQEMFGWFGAPPVLRFQFSEVTQGQVLKVDLGDAFSMDPLEWSDELNREWKVQAVVRTSRTGREAGLSSGDVHSVVHTLNFSSYSEGAVALHLDQVVPEASFEETERLRLFEFTSPALSKFHGNDYSMRAGVLLPKNYKQGERYPVVYSVTGFGGDYNSIRGWLRTPEGSPLENCIVVVPDANNRFGHSVFCDSDSIGPWGQALVHELIPALEKKDGGAGATQRYVTGVSSGGWSSLWLQVTYPEQFSGCWSHVPDPIDFHDFQGINLYEPLEDGSARNMFVDEQGRARGLARRNGVVIVTMEQFAKREHILNPGGQIRSFDATFSPLTEAGLPRRVFDIETGEIDHEATEAWRKYDISNTLLSGWDELRPRLKGKIHVYAGAEDTFFLEGAVERFQALAKEAGLLEDMVVEVIPGMAHQQYSEGHQDMLETIRQGRLAQPARD